MMADPSKDLRDAASPARVLLPHCRQLAEQLQVHSAELARRPHELRRWHDGLHQSVAIWALARLSRLETTVPRLEDGLAGASRAELAGIADELAGQVYGLRAAADALTRAHQVGDDLSVGAHVGTP
jgi:hypothetical protein